ncbi:recombinase family protein [Metabacillus endolithicus]|uniref:Recombinase family protein n=1 Tax=Metabacillus endolithicus TaxID=1535204 RepID=A0ABW5C1P5_9BACI
MNPTDSIYQQQCIVEEFALEHELSVKEFIIDEHKTGLNQNREGFQKLMHLVEHNLVDLILVPFFDRLGRDDFEMSLFLMKLKGKGIECISIVEEKYLSQMTETEIVQVAINASEENKARHKRIMQSTAASLKKGEYAYNKIPFGYSRDEHRKLYVNEYGKIVKDIFQFFLEFQSIPKVVKLLEKYNDNDFGVKLDYGKVYYTLRNRTYTGFIYSTKRTEEGEQYTRDSDVPHEPIISDEVYKEVQSILQSKKRFRSVGSHFHLFSGVISCSECSQFFKGKEGIRYKCEKCGYSMLDKHLTPQLLEYIQTLENPKDFRRSDEYKKETNSIQDQIDELELKYATLNISYQRFIERTFLLHEKLQEIYNYYNKQTLYEDSYTYLINHEKHQRLKEVMLERKLKIVVKKVNYKSFEFKQMVD